MGPREVVAMSMRTVRRSLIVAGAGAVLLAGGIFAGKLAADSFAPPTSPHRHSPARMFAFMARRLDLSNTQQAEIKDVLRSHESDILAQIQSQRTARTALHAAIAAQPLDEGNIRAKAAALGQVEADGAVLRARMRQEIWPILNNAQQQKLEQFGQRMTSGAGRMADAFKTWVESNP